ncbi:MAG: hypothetical protein JJE04_03930 [Acidobacteriia bacterium]|nr:hypothetical protein [Terriglobia bacterium]
MRSSIFRRAVVVIALWPVYPLLVQSTLAQLTMSVPAGVIAAAAGTAPVIHATVGTGLFRSVDQGLNWTASHLRPAGHRQPGIVQLVPDPGNSQILYASTDTDDGAVWKSTDGGLNWATAGEGLPIGGGLVEALILIPGNRQTLFAKIGSEIYKTTNSAASWTLQSKLPVENAVFAVAPSDSTVMFYAVGNAVYRSRDEGVSWSQLFPLPVSAGSGILAITVDPTNAAQLFVAVRGNGAGFGVYRSLDQGDNFTRMLPIQPIAIYVSPASKPVYYASSFEDACLWRSSDNGNSWDRFCLGQSSGGVRVAFEPSAPARMWAATSFGILFSDTSGSTWLSRAGFVKPTLMAPSISYDFFLPPNTQGKLEFPLKLVETDRWSVPINVSTSGEPWLTLSGVASATAATATIGVNTQGMVAGTYTASVRISSAQVVNQTVTVPIRLNVQQALGTQPELSIDTLAGVGQNSTFGDGGPAAFAGIGPPDSITVDQAGGIYISDPGNNRVRRITAAGIIDRFAGTGRFDFNGDGGDAVLAGFRAPRGLAVDNNGLLLIADSGNNRIRAVTSERVVQSLQDGLDSPRGVAVDSTGNIYVALPTQHVVVRVSKDGVVSRFAGNGSAGFRADGVAAKFTRLNAPNDVAVDRDGNVYIADTGNHRIRKVTSDGKIQTVAGNGVPGFQGDSETIATLALSRPSGIGLDEDGNLLIADTENNRIRVVSPQGSLRTLAGNGTDGFSGDGGPALAAQLRSPVDVAAGASGQIYIADSLNVRVRKLVRSTAPVPAPEIAAGGFVNAADGSARLSPGVLFSIYGKNLAAAEQQAGAAPWPTSLGGVSVNINGRNAPLYFVSPGQINGQVPYESSGGRATARVSVNGISSPEATAQITSAAPGIFQFGVGRAVVVNADGAVNTADAPTYPGQPIVVYLTGQGLLDNSVTTGAAAPSQPLSRPRLPVSATVGGMEANVLFLGLSPGFIGLAQGNLVVPDLPPGDHTVVITIGGAASNAPVITVANP